MNELYRCLHGTSIMVITNIMKKNRNVLTYMHKSMNNSEEYSNIQIIYTKHETVLDEYKYIK